MNFQLLRFKGEMLRDVVFTLCRTHARTWLEVTSIAARIIKARPIIRRLSFASSLLLCMKDE